MGNTWTLVLQCIKPKKNLIWKQGSVCCTLPRTTHFSQKVNQSQIPIWNDGFTPPNSTNNEGLKFGVLKTTFGNNKKFIEQVCKQNCSSKSLPKRYFYFFRPTKVSGKGLSMPNYHIWKHLNVHRAMSNTIFFSRKVPFQIHFEKDGFTLPNSTKNRMPTSKPPLKTSMPLSHEAKSFFPYKLFLSRIHIEKDDFASSTSTKQLMCEPINNIRKQLNLSLTTLNTMSRSENGVFPQIRVKKNMVCNSQLNSTSGANAWANLKNLFENLRSSPSSSRKT